MHHIVDFSVTKLSELDHKVMPDGPIILRILIKTYLAPQHGCSELETRLRIKNIRYGLLTQLLMSSLSQSLYRTFSEVYFLLY